MLLPYLRAGPRLFHDRIRLIADLADCAKSEMTEPDPTAILFDAEDNNRFGCLSNGCNGTGECSR